MRLVKMFGLAALAVMAAMAFVGAASASAETSTQLCNVHTSLSCEAGDETSSVHLSLAPGTILKILGFMSILCLGELLEATPLGLDNPQSLHISTFAVTGCGFNAAHNSCTLTSEELPLGNLLKTGLDEGSLELQSGQIRLSCFPNYGSLGNLIECQYDLEGQLFSAGGQHLTHGESPLSGSGNCLGEEILDGLLETLEDTYILE